MYRVLLGLFIRLATIAVIIGLGFYWNRLFEALLVLVAILQFELAYRQHWLEKTRYEPVFAVNVPEKRNNRVYLEVKNVGSTPAYLVGVSRVLCNGVPLPPDLWSSYVRSEIISCLEPSSKGTLAVIDDVFFEEYFKKKRCAIEVSYSNMYEEWNSFRATFYNHVPMLISSTGRPPGFLLSIADYILMLRAYIILRRARRRLQR